MNIARVQSDAANIVFVDSSLQSVVVENVGQFAAEMSAFAVSAPLVFHERAHL